MERANRLFILAIFCSFSHSLTAQIPFHQGVNLTQWFQAGSARQVQFSRFTKKDFENIKSLGCDVIRLPVNLHAMTAGAPDYTLDPLLFKFLDQAVAWSEDLNIYLILDNHSFDPAVDTQPDIEDILVKVWTQLASHYKDAAPYLMYEVLNEPHGITDATWGPIQQSVIDAIRAHDQEHYIIVGGSNYNSYTSLANLPAYTDAKLIYTFHFYDPFLFTHQGASWVDPSLVGLAGMTFPYKSSAMPPLPSEYNGTWIQSAYNNYPVDGTVSKVKQLLDVAVNFKSSRNVPVFCGEFGVYIPNSDPTERVAWYEEIRRYLNQHDIPWTIWDYTGGFGVFEANSNELFEYDLNVPLLGALDFEVPPQKNFSMQPKTNGFVVYDDYAGEGIVTSIDAGPATLDYYNMTGPRRGEHAIHWKDAAQYGTIGFDFLPNVDLSLMPPNDYQLTFWVRCNSPGASFDIRFVDTKTGASDHPWRMGKTIDQEVVNWDGQWHQVTIALKDLEEKGSWDNAWFEPQGKFQWSAVDRLEIVAEQAAMTGIDFYFDDIELTGEEITIVLDVESSTDNISLNIYPNPFTGQSIIEYATTKSEEIFISIYDQRGQQVRMLFNGDVTPGAHSLVWHGDDDHGQRVASGLYLVRFLSNGVSRAKRLIVLK